MISRDRVFGVSERLERDSVSVTPVDRDSVVRAVHAARIAGCEAIVVSLLHSYRGGAHEAQVKAAAAAGKHIHVEKPIALTRASAEIQVAAARKAGVVLAVGFNRRFHPSIVAIRPWGT